MDLIQWQTGRCVSAVMYHYIDGNPQMNLGLNTSDIHPSECSYHLVLHNLQEIARVISEAFINF